MKLMNIGRKNMIYIRSFIIFWLLLLVKIADGAVKWLFFSESDQKRRYTKNIGILKPI